MPRELIGLGRPPRTLSDGDEIPEFQMWVGWNRDMDVQVGIGIPEDRAEGARGVGLIEALFDNEGDLVQVGQWLAEFARRASDDDCGSMVEEGETGYWKYDQATMKRNALALVMAMDQVKAPFGASVWWHPTRQSINTLIRTLRKARDAAFGRDE